jgi:hypothetical protein
MYCGLHRLQQFQAKEPLMEGEVVQEVAELELEVMVLGVMV